MSDHPITLYRCAACCKWSTAKKRPSHHLRWVGDGSGNPEHGDFVNCGPFETYEARKVA